MTPRQERRVQRNTLYINYDNGAETVENPYRGIVYVPQNETFSVCLGPVGKQTILSGFKTLHESITARNEYLQAKEEAA
jgi:hypothetical protein